MAEKGDKKRTIKKTIIEEIKVDKKPKKKAMPGKKGAGKSAEKLNEILVENFVNLQKAMTNMAVKFDNMSDQISKLLQLFEISARSFAEKLAVGVPEIEKDREFLDKLNRLLEQNKIIAKGLTMMEEKMKERLYGIQSSQPRPAGPEYTQSFQSKQPGQ